MKTEQKYTPEPWNYVYENKVWEGYHEPLGGDFEITFQAKNEATAKRIVECVNAFEGVENPSEWRTIQGERIRENVSLKQERDDLKGLLKELDNILESNGNITPKSFIRTAIQIATGKISVDKNSNQ